MGVIFYFGTVGKRLFIENIPWENLYPQSQPTNRNFCTIVHHKSKRSRGYQLTKGEQKKNVPKVKATWSRIDSAQRLNKYFKKEKDETTMSPMQREIRKARIRKNNERTTNQANRGSSRWFFGLRNVMAVGKEFFANELSLSTLMGFLIFMGCYNFISIRQYSNNLAEWLHNLLVKP